MTRTVHFGTPTAAEKDAFTRVLKGHIQIDMAVFPKGTTGYVLDVLARLPLWKAGLDFRHGTGHGVGHYLNVHEGKMFLKGTCSIASCLLICFTGPQGIGTRVAYNDVPLQSGMTVTNGKWGKRQMGKGGIGDLQ